jgi:protein-S-isoprenylcysteine O-methyltransferase Ste14
MDNRRFYGFIAVQIVAAVVLLAVAFAWPGAWNLQREIGTALVLAGICAMAVARFQLGRSFSVKAEARTMVTHGLYSRIRNPIYVFGMFLLAGFVMILRRPILWLLVLVIAVVQIIRARREARVLEAAFGDAYREYRRKTWF